MVTKRTSLFLMANLGSEVSQIFSYVNKGQPELAKSPAMRAQKIIDEMLTLTDVKGREGELEIIKEIMEDVLKRTGKYNLKQSDLDEYFLPFAVRLMSLR